MFKKKKRPTYSKQFSEKTDVPHFPHVPIGQSDVRGEHARPHYKRFKDGGRQQSRLPIGRGRQAGEESAGRPRSCPAGGRTAGHGPYLK